jgi:hypothetical protein
MKPWEWPLLLLNSYHTSVPLNRIRSKEYAFLPDKYDAMLAAREE